ncbi:hypothetical protein EXN66_Car003199 [Channa argus]|uniref:Uncharacterized protein n=1 Tax=Channa argus TaxID=215402 RepID=A0A6G1PBA7_CHAAH|nr:hypothetical protein EXN66_Car003199 [Channa argus]
MFPPFLVHYPVPLPLPNLKHLFCFSPLHLFSISFLPLQHQGARLPGSHPTLARSGWWKEEESPPPLPVCMQIGLILIKRQLHILLKSLSEVGKEKAYLSGETEVV